MVPGPGQTCRFDPGANYRGECATANCAAGLAPLTPNNQFLTPKERCISGCVLKNIAMCEALTMGGAGIGAKAGAYASIPSGGTLVPVFVPLGGGINAEICSNQLTANCQEKCNSQQCDAQ